MGTKNASRQFVANFDFPEAGRRAQPIRQDPIVARLLDILKRLSRPDRFFC